jgi:hypothetical protein
VESEWSLAFCSAVVVFVSCCCCLRQSPSGLSEAALIGCHTWGLREVIQTLPGTVCFCRSAAALPVDDSMHPCIDQEGAGCDTLENGGHQVVRCTAERRQMGEGPVFQLYRRRALRVHVSYAVSPEATAHQQYG